MEKCIQDDDIIVLGVASVETKGGSGEPLEEFGDQIPTDISDE